MGVREIQQRTASINNRIKLQKVHRTLVLSVGIKSKSYTSKIQIAMD